MYMDWGKTSVSKEEYYSLLSTIAIKNDSETLKALVSASWRKSMKARASRPREPMPYAPGRENTGSRMPAERSMVSPSFFVRFRSIVCNRTAGVKGRRYVGRYLVCFMIVLVFVNLPIILSGRSEN